MRSFIRLLAAVLLLAAPARAQFRDDFDSVTTDPEGRSGWRLGTGDGSATMALRQEGEGYGTIVVDATADERNIWWAFINREVSSEMDLAPLRKPGHAVRIEARIRVSHAPRRVNLQIQTGRTTDYHSHLMEYDIPRAGEWHTISLTTSGLDAGPGDVLIGHMALMDWGSSIYRVDVDYVKVDIVDTALASPDLGEPIPYHPPIADPDSFTHALGAVHDGMIDLRNEDVNLNDWSSREGSQRVPLLTAEGDRHVILRWDMGAFAGKRASGSGLLELTSYSVLRKSESVKDFGILRIVEILSGDASWDEGTVTSASFRAGDPLDEVLNPQMIIDWPATEERGGKTHLTIPRPVLQRLIDGTSRGIAIKALGGVSASFFASEFEEGRSAPRLLFDLQPD